MEFLCIGLSHKTAGIALREKLALPEPQQLRALQSLEAISEAMLISTCNRVEYYTLVDSLDGARERIQAALARDIGSEVIDHLYEHQGESALVHLFRVAASLDSMVVGEPQILGQVKDSLELAQRAGCAKTELVRACTAALACAKRVRTETGIGRMATSMASAAVQLANKIFGTASKKCVLVVGAGEMGELAARHLLSSGASAIIITNRTFARAEELAALLQVEAQPFEEMLQLLTRADLVFCSTASQTPIFTSDNVSVAMKHRKHRPLFMVDLAVPRDVAPDVNELDAVYAYDVDDIQKIVAETASARAVEAIKAEAIIAEEVAKFARDRAIREASPIVAQLRARAYDIARAEAARTLSQFGDSLDEKQRRSIEAMGLAIVNKLLHQPTTKLRSVSLDVDQRLIGAAAELFGLVSDPAESSSSQAPSEDAERSSALPKIKR